MLISTNHEHETCSTFIIHDKDFVFKKIAIGDAGTPQPDRDLNVEILLVKL